MICREIMEIIEKRYPKSCAMDWDNVGLLVGSPNKEVRKIIVALDVSDELIDAAIAQRVDLIVTHHPLIFSAMKRVTDEDFIGNRIMKMIRHDISYYAMHTNYDVMGMSDLSGAFLQLQGAEVLEITCPQNPVDGTPKGIGKIADLKETVTLKDYCEWVKERFQLNHVKVFGDLEQEIRRVAISPGSGKSMIGISLASGADALVTGDIDHHSGIDATAQGLSIIDAGHYGIEHIFIRDMGKYLRENLSEVEVIEEAIRHPFEIV